MPEPDAASAPDPPDAALLDRFAPFYDLEYATYGDDLAFFAEWAQAAAPAGQPGARVLDLACGSGRVLLALAAAGHTVTGVDASPAMLARATAHLTAAGPAVRARLVEASLEALPPDLGTFDLALAALNSFAYLPEQANQLAMLAGTRRHLAPGGLLILDLTPVGPDGPFPVDDALILQGSWPRPEGGLVRKFVSGHWDAAAQQHHVTWIYDEEDAQGRIRRAAIPQTLRYTYRWEAQLLLERTGYALRAAYGSYDLEAYAADSPRLLLVAAAA